ncbi:hypothetical protein ACFPL7_21130 [Dongia soli]|uniref:Uncharacterized protein n=1 Tax=Dongia soli TaxID=600628 RepID=A0ABU5E8B6_9PROT|nr:hypothetical protein [Dongia soli]MDY0882096.1 hypothetical protein [Dongia soli]
MTTGETIILIILVVAAAVTLGGIYRRDRRRLKQRRSILFSQCLTLLEGPQLRQNDLDYPVLTGRYQGHSVHIDAIIDHIAVRKVPSLWLRANLMAPLPGMPTLDILMRAHNVEFFSPSNDLPHRLDLPLGWPKDATIRSDDPARLPPPEILTPHMNFFDKPQAKEMLLTAKGVRLVFQARQADRLQYQVLRQADFENPVLAPALLQDLLDRLIAIHRDVATALTAHAPDSKAPETHS